MPILVFNALKHQASKSRKFTFLNPFHPSVSFLYSMKTSEAYGFPTLSGFIKIKHWLEMSYTIPGFTAIFYITFPRVFPNFCCFRVLFSWVRKKKSIYFFLIIRGIFNWKIFSNELFRTRTFFKKVKRFY